MTGAMLVFDPPRLLEYTWDVDVLRWELEPRAGGTVDQGGKQGIGRAPAPDERGLASGAWRQHAADQAFHLRRLHADSDGAQAVGDDPTAPIDDLGGKVLDRRPADELREAPQVLRLGHPSHAISSERPVYPFRGAEGRTIAEPGADHLNADRQATRPGMGRDRDARNVQQGPALSDKTRLSQ